MDYTLALIHIPKCAGSSLTRALKTHYGPENSYLIGEDSSHALLFFPTRAAYKKDFISGHRAVSFYPRTQAYFFISIIRDPVTRALSLYDFVTRPHNAASEVARNIRSNLALKWRKKGVDPGSLCHSVENSPQLRYEISNAQCRFLSDNKKNWLSATYRHYVAKESSATFKTAFETINNRRFLIGTQEQSHLFAERLSKALAIPSIKLGDQNKSKDHYLDRYFQDDETIELVKHLNIEDQKLYQYVAKQHDGIFEN